MFEMTVKGTSNGVRQWTSKKTGVIGHTLMISVPGSASCLEIGLPNGNNGEVYKTGTNVELKVRPKFWDHKFAGLELQ